MPFEALKINRILSKKIKTKIVYFKKYVNQSFIALFLKSYYMGEENFLLGFMCFIKEKYTYLIFSFITL